MKRILALILTLSLVFSMTACNTKDVEPAVGASNGAVAVDESLLNVDLTLPASMFKDEGDMNLDSYASENGFKKAVKNEDGSITITMSKSKHKKILSEMAAGLEENFKSLINAEDSPYIKAITHSEHFEIITADVDKAAYEGAVFNMTPFILGMSAMIYRVYTGGEVRTEIIIRDAATKEIMSSTVYPDSMQKN